MSAIPKIELLAPGGSLSQAVHALRAGATAIYAGAKRFSARSHAGNLDLNQFARLCGEAKRHQAVVYLALNTILTDVELPDALDLAWELWSLGVAACIVQDIGLLRALHKMGPPWALHASTQMAVHSASGVRILAEWGVQRVVLARELTVAEILAIHQAVPEMELECFIHGSLCYSVSGLCLASGLILQRSGNRGDCGQVCRTWSTLQPGNSTDTAGSWWSMNDLDATDHIEALGRAGVGAFKIEGRMKSPEWTAAVVAHYRAVLDASDPGDHRERARQAFGRHPSPGWLADPKGKTLVNRAFAGNLGRFLGRIEAVKDGRALVRLECPLAVSDGIMLLRPGSPPKPWQAAVRGIFPSLPQSSGPTKLWEAGSANRVWIQAESDGQAFLAHDKGLELRKVADHAANLSTIKPESLPLFRMALATDAMAIFHQAGSASLQFSVPSLGGLIFSLDVRPLPATGSGSLVGSLADILSRGGDSGFVADPLRMDGSLDGWFLPPAALKEIRRSWHLAVLQGFTDLRGRRRESLVEQAQTPENIDSDPIQSATGQAARWRLPLRSRLSPLGDLPFVASFAGLKHQDLAQWQGMLVLPLAPVWFDDKQAYSALHQWLVDSVAQRPAPSFLLGLGNIAQIDWYRRLRGDPEISSAIGGAFADYGIYAANAQSRLTLIQAIADLRGILPWIESAHAEVDPDFHPPLFISRACFHRESQGLGCPADKGGCAKSWDYQVTQGKRMLRIMVRDCLSYTF